MNLNVDVICNCTGEIFREGLLLANAHIYIAKRKGKIVREDIHMVELDNVDGGPGKMEVHDIYVDFPDVLEEEKAYAERMRKASEFWCYTSKVMAGV